MPYITTETRETLDPAIQHVLDALQRTPQPLDGALNYTITRIVTDSFHHPAFSSVWRYHELARAHAVFQMAAAELYRRLVGPYEDAAQKRNGDLPCYKISSE